ncbi:hypothetical protein HDU91_000785 [Kappamyces sp. JEL0680]|nr:hypothetical protein HDU91_000785 [Kappamyces sp. JEL0680]
MEAELKKRLSSREARYLKRSLFTPSTTLADFTSNDYLGLARNAELRRTIHARSESSAFIGATGSRLLSGQSREIEDLEGFLSDFHQAEDALVFNSGFDANFGLFSCIAQKEDGIIYDELVHASVHEGIRASRASFSKSFAHNDTRQLTHLIQEFRQLSPLGHLFVGIESVYSMDGCLASLQEIVQCMQTDANVHLVIDEAHSTGICGPSGRGLVCELGLQDKVFARVHTFGKAMGCHGAVVLGSSLLKEYLVNYARPIIFSTFLPMHSLVSIRLLLAGSCRRCAYEYMAQHQLTLLSRLHRLIRRFRDGLRCLDHGVLLDSATPIQGIIVPGNKNVVSVARAIQQQYLLDVRPIRSPTVPRGQERLRICIHVHNTDGEIDALVGAIVCLVAEPKARAAAKL